MSPSNGSPAEMPIVPITADWPSPDDTTAERLLSGQGVGRDAPPEQQALALVLSAAARPATRQELSGEDDAVAAFVLAVASGPRAKTWTRRGAQAKVKTFAFARKVPVAVAGGVLAVAVALGGTAAAGALPAPLQRVAHSVFGAPDPAPAGPARPAEHPGNGHLPGPVANPSPSATVKAGNGKANSSTKATDKAAKAVEKASKSAAKASAKAAKSSAKASAKATKTNGNVNGNGQANGHDKPCRGNGKNVCG